jgi:hypothetical protein
MINGGLDFARPNSQIVPCFCAPGITTDLSFFYESSRS